MADREGKLMADLGPATEGSGEARQEGYPLVWELSEERAQRIAIAVLEHPTPMRALLTALRWAFAVGQIVGQGTMGPADRCPACMRKTGFADGGSLAHARCICCDHTWGTELKRRSQ